MKKRFAKMLALLLAVLLLFTGCAQKQPTQQEEDPMPSGENNVAEEPTAEGEKNNNVEASEYPEYLNLDSAYPIIKDEYAGTIKLKVAVIQDSTGGEWDDLWLSKYLKEKYNVEFEVESILSSAAESAISLMFNSGELPDLMLNFGLNTTQILSYGQEEGLFLKMDEYLDDTLTPNFKHWYDDTAKAACATPDGHLYFLPMFADPKLPGSPCRIFVNTTVLNDLGLENPKTLNEFVDAMYKVKEADVTGIGSENVYPIGGAYTDTSCFWYFLNALGYTGEAGNGYNYGSEPTVRDGKVVIPAYDMDVFKEFLTLMHQLYQDGIVNPELFTMDNNAVVAALQGAGNVVYSSPVYVTGMETWSEWEACYPLTSDWQDAPEWPLSFGYGMGNFMISADTEYPELCMKIAELYCNTTTDDCYALWVGPGENSEWNYGYVNEGWNEETQSQTWDTDALPEGVDLWTYLMSYLAGWQPRYGAYNTTDAFVVHTANLGGTYPTERKYDPEYADDQWRMTFMENEVAYGTTDLFPTAYFIDADTNNNLIMLKTVLDPYIKEQVALFITGDRDLSETDAFVKELESMGVKDLLGIYEGIYANMAK